MSLVGNGLIWTVAHKALEQSHGNKTLITMKVLGIIMAIVYLTLVVVFGVYGFKKDDTAKAVDQPASPPANPPTK
jgi:hypothetical protein